MDFMQANFYKIDLHVHTPASQCFKGKNDDNEFLSILRKAKDNDLRIIAITDHNSIEGYKRLIGIRSHLEQTAKSLCEITDSTQATNKLKDIKEQLKLYEDILVLPGLELEVRTGIHVLIIFNLTTEVTTVDKFLLDGGYSIESFGKEEPSTIPNWDIFNLFEESKKYDCILIDAHTDSNKGILNTIPKGQIRAACFKSDQLTAVCYKNEKQKDMLDSVLRTSYEYRRSRPLSFVKFSDAHKSEDVGSEFTYVKLDKICFESLRNAFVNPSEMVSIEEPSLTKILNKLINEEISFGVVDSSEGSINIFKKYACALHNSDGGYILIGVSDNRNKIGIDVNIHNIDKVLRIFTDSIIKDIDTLVRIRATAYELQNKNVILSLHVRKGADLKSIKGDGSIYSVQNRKLTILSAKEIQSIIEERQLTQIEDNILRRISKVETECRLTRNFFASIPILRKYKEISLPNILRAKVVNRARILPEEIRKIESSMENGRSRGNIFYLDKVQPARLQYAYLRYSLPLWNIRSAKNERRKKEDYLYIVPGGAVYYSPKNVPFFSTKTDFIISVSVKDPKHYGLKFVACFLKSSFFLWYCERSFGNLDIFEPNIFSNLRLPKICDGEKCTNLVKEVEMKMDNILKLERDYLTLIPKIKSKDQCFELTTKHNSAVDSMAYGIDENIYHILDLSKEQISMIESDLRMSEVFLPVKEDLKA
jgi:PHP family Zn ribbon phosphoesterase